MQGSHDLELCLCISLSDLCFGHSYSTLAKLLTRHIPTVDLNPKCSLCLEHHSKYQHRKALSFL